ESVIQLNPDYFDTLVSESVIRSSGKLTYSTQNQNMIFTHPGGVLDPINMPLLMERWQGTAVAQVFSLLIHELTHKLGWLDDSERRPDKLAAKIQFFMENLVSTTDLAGLGLGQVRALKMDSPVGPILLLTDGVNTYDLTTSLRNLLPKGKILSLEPEQIQVRKASDTSFSFLMELQNSHGEVLRTRLSFLFEPQGRFIAPKSIQPKVPIDFSHPDFQSWGINSVRLVQLPLNLSSSFSTMHESSNSPVLQASQEWNIELDLKTPEQVQSVKGFFTSEEFYSHPLSPRPRMAFQSTQIERSSASGVHISLSHRFSKDTPRRSYFLEKLEVVTTEGKTVEVRPSKKILVRVKGKQSRRKFPSHYRA
ncbi:MAG: hypothetical protein KDD22_09035, partial [Bdellovibrionales bacterium]|nr:hypothetical protein [Bdellovibrionales bacterium]